METMEEEGGEMMVGGVSALTLEWPAQRSVPTFKGVFPHKGSWLSAYGKSKLTT